MSWQTPPWHPADASIPPMTRNLYTFRPGASFAFVATIALLLVSVIAFLISTLLGVFVSFIAMLALCILVPASIPLVIIGAFMFQNTIIASFSPMVAADSGFDAVRAVNFVLTMTGFGAFFLASILTTQRLPSAVRPWLLASLAILGIILFYLALGAVRGEVRDALVYFRNTVTPIACFYIGLVAASQYRTQLTNGIAIIAAIAIVYGYCELFFTFDFLSLFNGDRYMELKMSRQIDTGYWEQVLRQTGFVLRDLNDAMITSFFNTELFGDLFPKVFRIGGPNFHSIAYAYALAIFSVWLMFQNRNLAAIFALPLLLVVGSKGAMILYLLAVCVRVGLKIMVPRTVTFLFLIALFGWICATLIIGISGADYHALGFVAGVRDFFKNPFGQGLGIGGILSGAVTEQLDWGLAQQKGATDVPVESAIGVMFYQMGIGGFAFVGLLIAIARKSYQLFIRTGAGQFMFGFVTIATLCANAILQEEAFYSPLALSLCLMLTASAIGTYWRFEAREPSSRIAPRPART
jgi:hypothetical protein